MLPQECIQMPADLAQPFDELHKDLCMVCLEWKLFCEVFALAKIASRY
jgi:hypothetical protein